MSGALAWRSQIEDLAHEFGLDYYPVEFDVVPPTFMTEVAVYGFPVRMPHWSFGVRYIHQFVQHRMGHSRIFEVVFPGNPGIAYLANNNTDAENTLICAHVIGHADFSKNNELFRRIHDQVSPRIVDLAAGHARRIEEAIETYGNERVEPVLDAALSLEPYIDLNQAVSRNPYPETEVSRRAAAPGEFKGRFNTLPGENLPVGEPDRVARAPIPPRPERDLMWFIAQYAPDLEGWERDIFLAVRAESYYFYPVFACQIMNEGWASYWHARLLREASFLRNELYVDAMKAHSDVVRPVAGENQLALTINPYHLGFVLWDRIIEREGLAKAREIMAEEDDFSFVRNYLDEETAEDLDLFLFEARRSGEVKVKERDLSALHEAIIAPKFNFGAPRVAVSELKQDGSLVIEHNHVTDGRGLELNRARRVAEYVHRVWRRPVVLRTVDAKGKPAEVEVSG